LRLYREKLFPAPKNHPLPVITTSVVSSIPYKSISHFSVETAGNMNPIQREFKRGADIKPVQKTLAGFILK